MQQGRDRCTFYLKDSNGIGQSSNCKEKHMGSAVRAPNTININLHTRKGTLFEEDSKLNLNQKQR